MYSYHAFIQRITNGTESDRIYSELMDRFHVHQPSKLVYATKDEGREPISVCDGTWQNVAYGVVKSINIGVETKAEMKGIQDCIVPHQIYLARNQSHMARIAKLQAAIPPVATQLEPWLQVIEQVIEHHKKCMIPKKKDIFPIGHMHRGNAQHNRHGRVQEIRLVHNIFRNDKLNPHPSIANPPVFIGQWVVQNGAKPKMNYSPFSAWSDGAKAMVTDYITIDEASAEAIRTRTKAEMDDQTRRSSPCVIIAFYVTFDLETSPRVVHWDDVLIADNTPPTMAQRVASCTLLQDQDKKKRNLFQGKVRNIHDFRHLIPQDFSPMTPGDLIVQRPTAAIWKEPTTMKNFGIIIAPMDNIMLLHKEGETPATNPVSRGVAFFPVEDMLVSLTGDQAAFHSTNAGDYFITGIPLKECHLSMISNLNLYRLKQQTKGKQPSRELQNAAQCKQWVKNKFEIMKVMHSPQDEGEWMANLELMYYHHVELDGHVSRLHFPGHTCSCNCGGCSTWTTMFNRDTDLTIEEAGLIRAAPDNAVHLTNEQTELEEAKTLVAAGSQAIHLQLHQAGRTQFAVDVRITQALKKAEGDDENPPNLPESLQPSTSAVKTDDAVDSQMDADESGDAATNMDVVQGSAEPVQPNDVDSRRTQRDDDADIHRLVVCIMIPDGVSVDDKQLSLIIAIDESLQLMIDTIRILHAQAHAHRTIEVGPDAYIRISHVETDMTNTMDEIISCWDKMKRTVYGKILTLGEPVSKHIHALTLIIDRKLSSNETIDDRLVMWWQQFVDTIVTGTLSNQAKVVVEALQMTASRALTEIPENVFESGTPIHFIEKCWEMSDKSPLWLTLCARCYSEKFKGAAFHELSIVAMRWYRKHQWDSKDDFCSYGSFIRLPNI